MTFATAALGLGFLILLVLSGTFSGSETALFSLDRIQLRRFETSASRRERLVAAVAAHPERLLAGILFGNTLVNVAASSVMVAITRRLDLGGDPVLVAVVLGAGVILVAGEILPKGIAVHWPARAALVYAPVLVPVLRVLGPVSRILERVALGVLRFFGVRDEGGRSLEWRELQLLFEDMQEGKGISEDEGTIASNIFTFFETRAYEIMTPRVDIAAVPVDLPPAELKARVLSGRHSRVPVYRDSLDQIVGYLSAKELLLEPDFQLEALLHPVHFVPERARLHRILAEVQSRHLGLVVVVNEYGGTAGILTQEDLVEEVVGEIYDEEDREAPEVEVVDERTWRVAGLLLLEDLAEAMGVDLAPGPAETVGGHIAHLLGGLPRPGDTVRDGAVEYRVLQIRRHRAQRVLVTWNGPQSPGGPA